MLFSIITFDKKIRDFIAKESTNIQEVDEKYNIINSLYPVDQIFEIQVREEVIKNTSEFFMDYLKNILLIDFIVVGSDFRFGVNASGSVKNLKLYFGPNNIKIIKRNKKYSTSRLKELLRKKEYRKIKKISKNINLKQLIRV